MKLADYVISTLAAHGIDRVFEMSGGAITHLLDAAYGRSDIVCVSVHHEQAAAFAAEGYARISGKPGVALATSGPGALNLLTGIGSCFFDSVPALFITGQVNTYEFKFERPLRQLGFQETDIVSIVKPLVKWAHLVEKPEEIRYALEKALTLAQEGRPGPVLLDLPMNIQRAEINPEQLNGYLAKNQPSATRQGNQEQEHRHDDLRGEEERPKGREQQIAAILAAMASAQRPLILAGGGVRAARATEALRRFARDSGLPVAATLMGLDAVAEEAGILRLGMIGSYGHRYANWAIANCDLLLVLGSRLDTRQTGTQPHTFARGALLVHVDIDPAELGSKVWADIAVQMDVADFLHTLERSLPGPSGRADDSGVKAGEEGAQQLGGRYGLDAAALSRWHARLQGDRRDYPTSNPPPPGDPYDIDPNRWMELLSKACRDTPTVYVLDVGQHQMWASQSLQPGPDDRLLNAGGMGAMGFALPASLGAALAETRRRIVVIAGDGGIQVNIQELETLRRLGLAVKLFVLNNRSLGMVRQFQDAYMGGRQQSTVIGYGCPDLVQVAQAYGWQAQRTGNSATAAADIRWALDGSGPMLVEVMITAASTAHPKLMVNQPLENMYPELPPDELRNRVIVDPECSRPRVDSL